MDYEYLSMAYSLYELGTWDKDTVIKRVAAWGKENNVDEQVIREFLSRVDNQKSVEQKPEVVEHSLEEKRAFLAAVAFKNGELKFGEAANIMEPDMVERYYAAETRTMSEEDVEKLHKQVKELPKEEIVDGEYAFKGGERTVVTPEPKKEEPQPVALVPKEEPQPIVIEPLRAPEPQDSTPKEEPTTEEDYQRTAENISGPEEDSTVRVQEVSEERRERLKKSKNRAKSFFLKAGIVTLTFLVTSGFTIPIVGGYLILANKIRKGEFNPTTKIGQFTKSTVEKIMNLGKTKEEIEEEEKERGKSK